MTLQTTSNRNDYTGNDSTAQYAYSYRIFSEDDLEVIVTNTTTDVETTLTKTTDYTVSGVGNANGTITLVDAGQAWISGSSNLDTGYKITIKRVVQLNQTTDIRNQGDFYPEAHENEFDKSRMVDQQQQEELDRSVKLAKSVASADFDGTIPASIVGESNITIMTDADGDAFVAGPTASEISSAQSYAEEAEEWASKVDGIVDATDYSSKAYAIGGTGVTDTASKGASKEWAIKTSGTVDTVDCSSKAYAIGGTGVTDTASKGASKEWATKTSGTVDTADCSSKAYAIGGTGVTDTASRGAAKEWATKTSGTVDTAEYSAKEYAQGTQAGTGGSAKDWASETATDVDSSGEYSAKEWALGTQTRGVASSGSAKDWANYIGGTVDDSEYSAKYYSNLAATEAATVTPDVIATETISASGDIAHSAKFFQYRRVVGNGGAVTASNTPFGTTTTNFTDGMQIVLVGTSDTNTVRLDYNDATSGALLNGVAILGRGNTLTLMYDATIARFVETSRNF